MWYAPHGLLIECGLLSKIEGTAPEDAAGSGGVEGAGGSGAGGSGVLGRGAGEGDSESLSLPSS